MVSCFLLLLVVSEIFIKVVLVINCVIAVFLLKKDFEFDTFVR